MADYDYDNYLLLLYTFITFIFFLPLIVCHIKIVTLKYVVLDFFSLSKTIFSLFYFVYKISNLMVSLKKKTRNLIIMIVINRNLF